MQNQTSDLYKNGWSRYVAATCTSGESSATTTPVGPDLYRRTSMSNVIAPQTTLSKPLRPKPHRYYLLRAGAQGIFTSRVSTYNGNYSYLDTYRYYLSDYVLSQSRILEADWSSRIERCWEKIWGQIRDGPDLAVDFAERKQTIRMLRQTLSFKGFVRHFVKSAERSRGYRRFKTDEQRKAYVDRQWQRMSREWNPNHPIERGIIVEKAKEAPRRYHAGQRAIDWATNKYLEYRYGWRPLVYSIYDTIDAIRRPRMDSWTFVKARSGVRKRSSTYSGSGSFNDPRVRRDTSGSYRIEIGTYWSLPTGYTFADFASLNPISWAWELTTLSFVVDWFVNIGQCIQNWENYFIYRNKFQGGYMTYSLKERREETTYFLRPVVYTYWSGGCPMDSTQDHTKYYRCYSTFIVADRQTFSSVPMPSGPRVKVNLNANRLLDAASLMWGYARRYR